MSAPKLLDRREFASFATVLFALSAAFPIDIEAQGVANNEVYPPTDQHVDTVAAPLPGPAGNDPKSKQSELPLLPSGTFIPGPGYGTLPKRISHRYVMGMLAAGNIRLEMHETIQQPGALHEPVDTHKHNEIWLVQRGSATLFINDVEHSMQAGDIGLVNAGDRHWVKNTGTTELAYFVVTVGPPE